MKHVQTSFIERIAWDLPVLEQRFQAVLIRYADWSPTERSTRLPQLFTKVQKELQPLALHRDWQQRQIWLLQAIHSATQLTETSVACRKMKVQQVPELVRINLCLRALPQLLTKKLNPARVHHTDGLHYVVDQFQYDFIELPEYHTVNVSVAETSAHDSLLVRLKGQRFSPISAHLNQKGELQNAYRNLPRYRVQHAQELVRDPKGTHIARAIRTRKRAVYPALKLSTHLSSEDYYSSKEGVLALCLKDIEQAYQGAVRIEFEHLNFDEQHIVSAKTLRDSYAERLRLLQHIPLWLLNDSRDARATHGVQEITREFGLQAQWVKKPVSQGLHLHIVDPVDPSGSKEQDAYQLLRQQSPHAVVQACEAHHFSEVSTSPRLKKARKTVMEVLLKELCIKYEVQQRKLFYPYPSIPDDIWLIVHHPRASQQTDPDAQQLSLDFDAERWVRYYGRMHKGQLELGEVPEALWQDFLLNVPPNEMSRFERSGNPPYVIYCSRTQDYLCVYDTEAVCLHDVMQLDRLVHQVAQARVVGIPRSVLMDYRGSAEYERSPAGWQEVLNELIQQYPMTIPAQEFDKYANKGKAAQDFYQYLHQKGHPLRVSLRNQDTGLLSSSVGLLIDRKRGLYAAGSAHGTELTQPTFQHVYAVKGNTPEVPEWFWESLKVWHVRHQGTTVYPYLFKHIREYALSC